MGEVRGPAGRAPSSRRVGQPDFDAAHQCDDARPGTFGPIRNGTARFLPYALIYGSVSYKRRRQIRRWECVYLMDGGGKTAQVGAVAHLPAAQPCHHSRPREGDDSDFRYPDRRPPVVVAPESEGAVPTGGA